MRQQPQTTRAGHAPHHDSYRTFRGVRNHGPYGSTGLTSPTGARSSSPASSSSVVRPLPVGVSRLRWKTSRSSRAPPQGLSVPLDAGAGSVHDIRAVRGLRHKALRDSPSRWVWMPDWRGLGRSGRDYRAADPRRHPPCADPQCVTTRITDITDGSATPSCLPKLRVGPRSCLAHRRDQDRRWMGAWNHFKGGIVLQGKTADGTGDLGTCPMNCTTPARSTVSTRRAQRVFADARCISPGEDEHPRPGQANHPRRR